MLRYWFSERTHWLRDGFQDPEPLEAPVIDEARRSSVRQKPQTESVEQRTARDHALILSLLGRVEG